MLFAHDTEANLLAAVGLVNSAEDPDTLTTLDELDAFFRKHGYTGWSTRKRADLDDIRAIRGEVRRLLTVTRDEAVATVNLWLAEVQAVPRLVRHDDMDWHIHAIADTAPMASRIRVETAMAMIDQCSSTSSRWPLRQRSFARSRVCFRPRNSTSIPHLIL